MTVIDATWLNPKYAPKYEQEGTLDVTDALNLVLLFYTVGQWTEEKKAEWLRITGSREASTKVMCDHIRAVIAEAPTKGAREAGL